MSDTGGLLPTSNDIRLGAPAGTDTPAGADRRPRFRWTRCGTLLVLNSGTIDSAEAELYFTLPVVIFPHPSQVLFEVRQLLHSGLSSPHLILRLRQAANYQLKAIRESKCQCLLRQPVFDFLRRRPLIVAGLINCGSNTAFCLEDEGCGVSRSCSSSLVMSHELIVSPEV